MKPYTQYPLHERINRKSYFGTDPYKMQRNDTMKTNEKKDKVKQLVIEMLCNSHDAMIKKIDKAINSGGIDIDKWEEDNSPMILPKIITAAILENESQQYQGKGTIYEKIVKKEVKNLKYYL